MLNYSRDTAVEMSTDVRLECFATGTPSPNISWFRYTHTGHRNGYYLYSLSRQELIFRADDIP